MIRYSAIPRHYVWKDDTWHPRQKGTNSSGRMFVVGNHDSELFYLRRLLCLVRGATSFFDLRSYMGATSTTFKDTCAARGMLLDDAEYIAAMQDMCSTECSVDALRMQFACMLVNCRPTNGCNIFEMFLPELCGLEDPSEDDVQCTLWALEGYSNALGHSLAELGFRLPSLRMIVDCPDQNVDVHCHNRDVAFAQFSDEQRAAATQVIAAVASGAGGIFYIQAAGGCGKSFWANGVSAALLAEGLTPIVVAASALAATVLIGGRTAHSVFSIPVPVDDNSWCHPPAEVQAAIIASDAVFWDECSMVHVDAANCVDRSLQDWSGFQQPFGGKVMIFMGDFQQLLPVVRGGSGDTATIMSAAWWPSVHIVRFTRNFRSDVSAYCDMLDQVGSGEIPAVTVPPASVSVELDEFCDRVFGDLTVTRRHVVCLTLEDAASINSRIISRLPGATVVAAAADVKINCRDPDLYSDEFVHSLQIPGASPAVLELKVGARYDAVQSAVVTTVL